MINQLSNLNWMSVLVAFASYFLLGGLWFTKFFGKQYKISLGKPGEVLPQKAIFIIGPLICCFIITLTIAILLYALNISTISGAAELGLLTGFGFLTANTINIAINPNMPDPLYYGLLSSAYHLAGMLIVSLILVSMK